jgi:hypothetical protein
MAALPVPADFKLIRTRFDRLDDWAYRMTWPDPSGEVELEVTLSDTQRCIAGLREPSPQWIYERAREQTVGRLRNDLPVLDQVRAWPQPLVLHAPSR